MIWITGIYKITNNINGKCYIGKSVNIKERWIRHRHKGKYYSESQPKKSHLYHAMRKYGVENFTFEVIEECSSDKLNEREIYYISHFNSHDPNFGYNMTLGGEGDLKHDRKTICDLWESGLTISDIAKQISGSRNTVKDILRECGVRYEDEAKTRWIKKKSRPVDQYDLNGGFIRTWPSARDAERELGVDRTCIGDCCNYMVKQAKGFRWRYANRSETAAMADLLD